MYTHSNSEIIDIQDEKHAANVTNKIIAKFKTQKCFTEIKTKTNKIIR